MPCSAKARSSSANNSIALIALFFYAKQLQIEPLITEIDAIHYFVSWMVFVCLLIMSLQRIGTALSDPKSLFLRYDILVELRRKFKKNGEIHSVNQIFMGKNIWKGHYVYVSSFSSLRFSGKGYFLIHICCPQWWNRNDQVYAWISRHMLLVGDRGLLRNGRSFWTYTRDRVCTYQRASNNHVGSKHD